MGAMTVMSDTHQHGVWSEYDSGITHSNMPLLHNVNTSVYLPSLVTKSYGRNNNLLMNVRKSSKSVKQCEEPVSGAMGSYREFRSRIRPAIFKGKSHCTIAVDPETHLQMVKEKQAMHEHRARPKTPVSLEPVQVSLSGSKTKKSKVKAKVSNIHIRIGIDRVKLHNTC